MTGRPGRVEYAPRRPGDPPILYANAKKIRREPGWSPRYTEIDPIVETAWRWFREHPDGYLNGSEPADWLLPSSRAGSAAQTASGGSPNGV